MSKTRQQNTTLPPVAVMAELADYALKSVEGRRCVRDYLSENPPSFQIDGNTVNVVAIGKAAQSMLSGAYDVLGENISRSLLISSEAYLEPDIKLPDDVSIALGDHPVPGKRSLEAGRRLLEFIADGGDSWLFLISGGASSLVEVLRPGVTLKHLQAVNRYMLSRDYPINEVNAVRQGLSEIKNGGLRKFLASDDLTALYISDVPDDDLHILGSGLLAGDGLSHWRRLTLDDKWRRLLESCDTNNPYAATGQQRHVVVANLSVAMEAIHQRAGELGWNSYIHKSRVEGDAEQVARDMIDYLTTAPAGLHIWGGETTVSLPAHPGIGGRAQQFVLAALAYLADIGDVTLMSLATDGRDGLSESAGAIVSSQSAVLAKERQLDIENFLKRADAGTCLATLDALIPARATGTNVNDLFVVYKSNNPLTG